MKSGEPELFAFSVQSSVAQMTINFNCDTSIAQAYSVLVTGVDRSLTSRTGIAPESVKLNVVDSWELLSTLHTTVQLLVATYSDP